MKNSSGNTARGSTTFQRACHELEGMITSNVTDVARDANEALAAAYSWEDNQETTGLTCSLLVSVVADLKRRLNKARLVF